MSCYRPFAILTFFIGIAIAQASVEFDKTEAINGVDLKSGKEDSVRHYQGLSTKTFPYSLEIVQNGITNFSEKCNNEYKSKRKLTPENTDCKYHNENLVESKVIRLAGEEGRYLVARQIYNRGSFAHYDLVQVQESKNELGQKTVTISLQMLEDDEVKKFIKPVFEKESAFRTSTGLFTLTEVGKKETRVTYEYKAETDHWLLNKEISVPQVFASISKSINDLFVTVDTASSSRTRELASN